MKDLRKTPIGIIGLLLLATTAHAGVPGQGTWETTLQGRDLDGDPSTFEAYYDTVLDITWLADANAALHSPYDGDSNGGTGQMNWTNAFAWAATLNVHGITGWRLAATNDLGEDDCTYSEDPSIIGGPGTDCGFNVDTRSSELASMFHDTLGNESVVSPDGTVLPINSALTNTGPFRNLQHSGYWSNNDRSDDFPWKAWRFDMESGSQRPSEVVTRYHAWAVYDGDVGAMALGYTAVLNIPDINDNGSHESAGLWTREDGAPQVVIRDSETKKLIHKVSYGVSEMAPVGLALIEDINDNGAPELALLQTLPDGRGRVQLRDARTRDWLGQINFMSSDWKAVAISAQDLDMDGISEISVLGEKDDGTEAAVQTKDSSTKEQLSWVPLSAQ